MTRFLQFYSHHRDVHYEVSKTVEPNTTDHILFLPNVPMPDRQIGGNVGAQSVMGAGKLPYKADRQN